jgi:hypothetical protein
MAGSYPDVPSRRIAYDADGSILLSRAFDTGILVEQSAAVRVELNDEDNVNSTMTTRGYAILIFPELREIDGIFARVNASNRIGNVDTSGDTTNGSDGTWTNRIADYPDPDLDVYPTNYRSLITSLAVSNARGLRVDQPTSSTNWRAIHVYGEIAAGETPDRLLWVDNSTGAEFGLPIDYGDIPRGSAEDREVKLRNNSTTMTAASVQVTGESLFLNSGNWYSFKEAAGSFQATLPLSSSIGASSDSPVITIRRITPDSETLGLHAGRAYANVGTWS